MKTYTKTTLMPVSSEELFSWHERDGAFERLSPPWDSIQLLRKDSTLKVGSETHLKIKKGPFFVKWIARHTIYDPPYEFADIQLQGPFASWEHHHRMHRISNTTSKLEDSITFRLPFGIGESFALRSIDQMFHYRHAILYNDLSVQKAFPLPKIKVAITWSKGMVWTALSAFLKTAGHIVIPIAEKPPLDDENFIEWDPINERIDSKKLEGIDAVIHLSKEEGTKGIRTLVNALNSLENPPEVLISTPAIECCSLAESSNYPNDFQASLLRNWEEEANRFSKGRCVTPRFGLVLSSAGGWIEKMCQHFSIGIGSILGSKEELQSWISLDDLVYSIYFFLAKKGISGSVNCCSPHLVTNRELVKTLGKVLCRPSLNFMSKIAFRSSDKGMLLPGCKMGSRVLEEEGYNFCYPKLEDALRHTLGLRKNQELI